MTPKIVSLMLYLLFLAIAIVVIGVLSGSFYSAFLSVALCAVVDGIRKLCR